MSAPTCRHGFRPSSQNGHDFSGSDEKKIDRHERKCDDAAFVAHRGLLFWTVCCVGCGRVVL
jgi:hypothetical protein